MSEASELKSGSYFMMNNEPVRVTRKEVVAFGTHSHTKLKIFYQGLRDKGEKSTNFTHGEKVEILDIIRKKGQVVAKNGNNLQIMDLVTYETHNASASKELLDEMREGDNISFIELNGQVEVVDIRELGR